MNHRLWGMRGYLGGPMDRAPDGGKAWREEITPFLQSLGVVVLDPCNKPISVGTETIENRQYRAALKENGQFAQLGMEIDPIRNVDLRMVDISDFLVINVDLDIYPCGTMEEMTVGNLQQKPIFIRCKQGKKHAPDWMFAMIPHEYIHSSWDDVKRHLCVIHADDLMAEPGKRWKFFQYDKMVTTVTPEASYIQAMKHMKGL